MSKYNYCQCSPIGGGVAVAQDIEGRGKETQGRKTAAAAVGTPAEVANVVLGAFWARPKKLILKKSIGARGIEVMNPCSQSTRATKLRHAQYPFIVTECRL